LPEHENGNQAEVLTEEKAETEDEEPKAKKRAARRSLSTHLITQTEKSTNLGVEKRMRGRRSLAPNMMPTLACR